MPKTVPRLYMGEQYDKEAQKHLGKAIEFEELAIKSEIPADREKYGLKAKEARDAAIEALQEANIASGPELKELRGNSSDF